MRNKNYKENICWRLVVVLAKILTFRHFRLVRVAIERDHQIKKKQEKKKFQGKKKKKNISLTQLVSTSNS